MNRPGPEGGPLPSHVRRQRMQSFITEREFARVSDLSDRFGISEVTVRNDLERLAALGHIRRVRGGALPRGALTERPFEETEVERVDEKRAIGRAAAEVIGGGRAVLMDAGTTVTAVAHALVERTELKSVTVFTNSLKVALALEPAIPRFEVVLTGGTLRPLQHSLVEPLAGAVLDGLHVATVLLGCNGVHPKAGITNVNLPEAQMKALMLRAAQQRIVVADGSKIGEIALARLCTLEEIDLLITGRSAPPAVVEALRERELEVLVAT